MGRRSGGDGHARVERSRVRAALAVLGATTVLLASTGRTAAVSAQGATTGWTESSEGFTLPDNPHFGQQWWLFNFGQEIGGVRRGTPDVDIRAPEAWTVTRGSPDVIVAVLDSGYDFDHVDLRDRYWVNELEAADPDDGIDNDGNGYVDDWRGWDFVDGDNDPGEGDGMGPSHGTAVASVVGASGGDGSAITGIAPEATMMLLRSGSRASAPSRAESIEYAVRHGARIIVMAYGSEPSGIFSGTDEEELAIRAHPDVLFVAASGNWGISNLQSYSGAKPCNTPDAPNLICVASTDENDGLTDFSNYGPEKVDLAAPGDAMIVSTPPRSIVHRETFESLEDWAVVEEGPVNLVTTGADVEWSIVEDPSAQDSEALAARTSGDPDERTRSVLMTRDPIELAGLEGCGARLRVGGTIDASGTMALVGLFPDLDGRNANPNAGSDQFSPSGLRRALEEAGGDYAEVAFPLRLDDSRGQRIESAHFGVTIDVRGELDTPIDFRIDSIEIECRSDERSDRDYTYVNGTSVSAPLTAGVAALVWSEFPELTVAQVREALMESATRVPALEGRVRSGGRLDAYGALRYAASLADGTPPPTPLTSPATTTTSAAPGRQPPRPSTTRGTRQDNGDSIGDVLDAFELPAEPLGVPTERGGAVPGDAVSEEHAAADDASAGEDGGGSGWVPWAVGAGICGAITGAGAWYRKRRRENQRAEAERAASQERTEALAALAEAADREFMERDFEAWFSTRPAEQQEAFNRYREERDRQDSQTAAGGLPSLTIEQLERLVEAASGSIGKVVGVARELATNVDDRQLPGSYSPEVNEWLDRRTEQLLPYHGGNWDVARAAAENEYNRAAHQRMADNLSEVGGAVSDTARDQVTGAAVDKAKDEARGLKKWLDRATRARK